VKRDTHHELGKSSAPQSRQCGLPVRIIAQTSGDSTAIAIAIGELAFAGAGLVVIAIIAILIGLLLPAFSERSESSVRLFGFGVVTGTRLAAGPRLY
jgi:hypothetical protein